MNEIYTTKNSRGISVAHIRISNIRHSSIIQVYTFYEATHSLIARIE